jgi:hypothetical protein
MKRARRPGARLIPVLAALIAVAAVAVAGAQPGDPFKGEWRGVDPEDGSTIRTAFGGTGATRQVTAVDDSSTTCGGKAFVARGTGVVDGDETSVTLEVRCPGQGVVGSFDVTYAFEPRSRTLEVIPFGVILSRPAD